MLCAQNPCFAKDHRSIDPASETGSNLLSANAHDTQRIYDATGNLLGQLSGSAFRKIDSKTGKTVGWIVQILDANEPDTALGIAYYDLNGQLLKVVKTGPGGKETVLQNFSLY